MNDHWKTIHDLENGNAKLTQRIRQLEAEIQKLVSKNDLILLLSKVFSIYRFMKSDKDLSFYTGFPNGDIFKSVLRYLNPGKKEKILILALTF